MRNPADWIAGLASNQVVVAACAGAAGGLIRWITTREDWREGVVLVLVGAVTAVAAGLFLAQFLPGTPILAVSLVSYTLGLSGIAGTAWLVDTARRLMAARLGR